MFEHKFFLNPCFNLNVLTLSLAHVLPYKFIPFIYIIVKYITIKQSLIFLNKYIYHKILCTINILYSEYNQYITVYYIILWHTVASWLADS